MKNFSKIVDNFDVTTKKYVDDGLAEKANSSYLATVATSGSYNDLSNKPTIPDVSGKANLSGGNTFSGKQTLNSPPADGYSIDASGYIKGSWLQAPSTGKASSNTGKVCVLDGSGWVYYRTPAEIISDGGGATTSQIPTVNNGTLTIQKNGTNVQTFSANQSGNATANITVPTKVSDLTNDSGYTTNKGTVTQVKINGTTNSPDSAGLVDLGTVGGSSDNSKHGYTELTNENLDTIREAGWYRADRGNTCTNRPSEIGTKAFILLVEKTAAGSTKQTLYYIPVPFSSIPNYTSYCRISSGNSNSWIIWQKQQTLCNGVEQYFTGHKSFDSINVSDSLQFTGDAGSNGQFAMSQGSSSAPKWVNLQVKVNGTIYTPDSSGLIDLGEISGGGGSASQYNDIY